jgi:hypothetical protein
VPEKNTRPTGNASGSPATNSRAAATAAVIRDGATSWALIDIDTSTATTIVARSRGTWTSITGRAMPSTRPTTVSRNATAGTCRRQPGSRGITRSSSGSAAKRTA